VIKRKSTKELKNKIQYKNYFGRVGEGEVENKELHRSQHTTSNFSILRWFDGFIEDHSENKKTNKIKVH
jgi:hypothetical protein